MKKSGFLIFLALAGCATAPMELAPQAVQAEPMTTDRLIAFHEERVKNDPQGAIGWAMLSESYIAKSREKDDDDAAIKGEEAARKSLGVRKANNARAAVALSSALLEQHRFSDALEAAELATRLEPGNETADRQVAEILLELGRYTEFEKLAGRIDADDPSGAVVLARWMEIKGDNPRAEKLLGEAALSSERVAHSAPQTTAWFYTKLGEAQFRFGLIDEARASLKKSLEYDPNSYKSAAAMTRLEAGLGNWDAVIEWGQETAKTAKMTDIEGLVADAFLMKGKLEQAKAIYQQIEKDNATPEMLALKPGKHDHNHNSKATKRHTHDRLFSMFLADRSRHPFLAHHAAEEDLENRKDIYAWDTFAWATYQYYINVPAEQTGEGDFLLTEAQQAIDKALATGVKDARILFHAGMIYKKLKPQTSAKYLQECLKTNPHFHALQAAEARATLKEMEASDLQRSR